MKVHKGYKFRLEPTEEQKVKINKTLGCCRFVYNSMLDRRIKAYQRRGESMSYIDTQNLLPQMKTYLPWLAEVDSQALKYSCRQVNYPHLKEGACSPAGLQSFPTRRIVRHGCCPCDRVQRAFTTVA